MSLLMLVTGAHGYSRRLHSAARRRAEQEGHAMLVVHVLSGSHYERQSLPLRRAIQDEMRWLLHVMLSPSAGAAGDTVVRLTVDVREGDIVDELMEAAETNRPDVVVMGTRRPDDQSQVPGGEYSRLLDYFESNSITVEFVNLGRAHE